jgi:hypothetical protein
MKFFDQELRELVKASKFAVWRQGYILEARFGYLNLEFPNYINPPFINLHVIKIGGNGKFTINDHDYTAVSKVAQVINLPFNSQLILTRNKESLGEICILGFSIDEIKEDNSVTNKWKSLIARCGTHSGIKLVGERLFASEGAIFERSHLIEDIKTNPPNITTKHGNVLKFNTAAEILDLRISDDVKNIKIIQDSPFIHRTSNMINIQPEINFPVIASAITPTISSSSNYAPQNQSINYDELRIYDSLISGIDQSFFSKNKTVKHHQSNGKVYAVLKTNGSISIPLGAVIPESKYILVIKGKKISGNGKINVGFSSGNDFNLGPLTIESLNYDKSVAITSLAKKYPTDTPKLNIQMAENGSGEILIERILLLKDLPLISRSQLITKFVSVNNLKNEWTSNTLSLSLKEKTQQAAILYAENPNHQFELPVVVQALTYAGKQWITKTAPFVKGFKIYDPYKQIENVEYSTTDPNFIIGSLNNLKISERIFIEEFPVQATISDKDIDILANCQSIVSPSRANAVILSNKTNKEVKCQPKPWFWLASSQNIEPSFFLYFEKSEQVTKQLTEAWAENFPKLVVVGTNLNCYNHIKKISPHLPYTQLINLFNSAIAIIDVSSSYKSGMLDLASQLGIPLITSNINYIDNNVFLNIEEGLSGEKLFKLINNDFKRLSNTFLAEDYFKNLKELLYA